MKFLELIKPSRLRSKLNFLRRPYFFDNYSSSIVLYRRDYLKIKKHFPLHTSQNFEDFTLINLSCPYKKTLTYKTFSHYGKTLNPYSTSVNGETLLMERCPNLNLSSMNTLPAHFKACQLCKNELSCLFSKKRNFKPAGYDIYQFIKFLRSKGFTNSKEMQEKFESLYDEEGYLYEQPISFTHFIILLVVAVPIIIVVTPFFFVKTLLEKTNEKKNNLFSKNK